LRRAERFEPLRTILHDERYAGEGLHILHDSRSAERTDNGGKRRLHARLSAMAFDRFDETRLFAADVRAGAARDGDVEVESAAENVLAEESTFARFGEGLLEHDRAVIKLAADVDVGHRIRSDRESGD